MKKLYNEEMVLNLNKKIKKSLLIALLPLAVIIPFYVLVLFIVEMDTELLYQIISSIIFTLWSWVFIFEISFNILPSKKRITHINGILKNKETEFTGTVKEIVGPLTLERSVKIMQVLIIKDYDRHKVYFNVDLNKFDIELDKEIKVVLVNNFIKEYEVI